MDAILQSSTVLDGTYRIERPLGKGGMGAVYLATHLGTTRTVALKVIVPHLVANQDFFVRFQREAEAAGRLRHPNVVNVTDFGVTTHGGGELAYLVMEYLDGQTLADFLKAEPRPALAQVADVVEQIALALDAAHAIGIVHRDLKPENVWLESNRRGGYNVKVLDFGIAKVTDPQADFVPAPRAIPAPAPATDADGTLVLPPADDETAVLAPRAATGAATLGTTSRSTIAGSLIGTPAYMSPEQCQGEAVDGRSDVYSLAVMTYQMLAGEIPFRAETLAATLQLQIASPPPPLDTRKLALPSTLAAVVEAGLAKDRELRPRTAGTFAARFRAGTEGEARLLREAKDLINAQTRAFLPLLLCACVPAIAGAIALRALLALIGSSLHPPAAVLIALGFGLSVVLFVAGTQLYEVVCTLALQRFTTTRRYAVELKTLLRELLRLAPRLLGTKVLALADLRPGAFFDHALWTVVCAAEGRSGRDALRRSAELVRGVRPLAGGAIARQFGIAIFSASVFPVTFVLTDIAALREFGRTLAGWSALGLFFMIYPMTLIFAYLAYGPARVGLYWAARQCLGEADPPELPDANARAPRPRRATLLWTALPALCLVIVGSGLARLAVRPATNLAEAALEGRWTTADALAAAGNPIDTRDGSGSTALMHAIPYATFERIEGLIARGADVNARNRRDYTPLRVAVLSGRADVVRLLLDHGADPNVADERGRTPLMHAAMRGHAEIVSLLLARRADPALRDETGRTARDYAALERHDTVVALLR